MTQIGAPGTGAAFAFLIAIAAPALGQDYGGSNPPPAPESRSSPQAPPTLAEPAEVLRAAVCAVGRDAGVATSLLATQPRSAQERERASALLRAAQRCLRLRDQIATPPMIARGAAAEAIYEAQFAAPQAARAPALAAMPLPRPAPSEERIVVLLAPMYDLADCSVARVPDLVRALLATEPKTPAETTAMQALHPTFTACVPVGTQLTYDPRVMRSFLAEGLYRWSVVQRDGPSSPWAAAAPAAPGAP